jgi:hypothetical protein
MHVEMIFKDNPVAYYVASIKISGRNTLAVFKDCLERFDAGSWTYGPVMLDAVNSSESLLFYFKNEEDAVMARLLYC